MKRSILSALIDFFTHPMLAKKETLTGSLDWHRDVTVSGMRKEGPNAIADLLSYSKPQLPKRAILFPV